MLAIHWKWKKILKFGRSQFDLVEKFHISVRILISIHRKTPSNLIFMVFAASFLPLKSNFSYFSRLHTDAFSRFELTHKWSKFPNIFTAINSIVFHKTTLMWGNLLADQWQPHWKMNRDEKKRENSPNEQTFSIFHKASTLRVLKKEGKTMNYFRIICEETYEDCCKQRTSKIRLSWKICASLEKTQVFPLQSTILFVSPSSGRSETQVYQRNLCSHTRQLNSHT